MGSRGNLKASLTCSEGDRKRTWKNVLEGASEVEGGRGGSREQSMRGYWMTRSCRRDYRKERAWIQVQLGSVGTTRDS